MLVVFRIFLFALALVAGSAAGAGAFFPDTEDILSRVERQYDSVPGYEARLGFANDTATISVWRKDRKWKQEWVDSTGNSSVVTCAAVGDDLDLAAAAPGNDTFPLSILSFWYLNEPTTNLAMLGVDTSRVEYGFANERPCLIIGDRRGSQIWLDNETLALLRVVRKTFAESFTVDFLGHAREGAAWLPASGELVITRDLSMLMPEAANATGVASGLSVLRVPFTIKWGSTSGQLNPELFDVTAFASRYAGLETLVLPESLKFLFYNLPIAQQ